MHNGDRPLGQTFTIDQIGWFDFETRNPRWNSATSAPCATPMTTTRQP